MEFAIVLHRSWNYGCCSKLLSTERAHCCWKTFKLFDGLPLEKVWKCNIRNIYLPSKEHGFI